MRLERKKTKDTILIYIGILVKQTILNSLSKTKMYHLLLTLGKMDTLNKKQIVNISKTLKENQ